MARVRINHYASKTINVGNTLDWETMIIELFIALLLGVFAYMGYVANIALLLFLCAAGSLACFLAFLHNVYIVIADKLQAKNNLKYTTKETSMKFGMQAVLTAVEGKGDELADIMLQASKVVSTIDGCLLYIVQRSMADTLKILITEIWENKEAHQSSLMNEEVRTLIDKAKPIIGGMEHHPAVLLGGHGV